MATYSSAITQVGVRNVVSIVGGINELAKLDFSLDQGKYMLVHLLGRQNTGIFGGTQQFKFQYWDSIANTWRDFTFTPHITLNTNLNIPLTYASAGDLDRHLRTGRAWAGVHNSAYVASETQFLPSIIFPGERLIINASAPTGTVELVVQNTTFQPAA